MKIVKLTLFALIPLFLLSGCWDKLGDMGGVEKMRSIIHLQCIGVFCKTWEGEMIRGGLNSGYYPILSQIADLNSAKFYLKKITIRSF